MNSMLNTTIHFSEHSAWWLLLCIFIASAYAFLLYYPAKHFSLAVRRLLAAARWLLVFMLMVFLFSPYVKSKLIFTPGSNLKNHYFYASILKFKIGNAAPKRKE